jgi:hypothetical protein
MLQYTFESRDAVRELIDNYGKSRLLTTFDLQLTPENRIDSETLSYSSSWGYVTRLA